MVEEETLSENELIAGCINGDRTIQKMLYMKYAKTMYNICLAYEPDRDNAKDILQEAFIKVFRSISTYEREGSLQGWIRRIITNTAIDHFRKNQIAEKRFIKLDAINKEDEPQFLSSNNINNKEILDKIKNLPNGTRMVFNLYALEGYSHKEISQKLGISEGTSKSQLSRARQILQEWLSDYI